MRNRRRQREAAYAALAIHAEPYERAPIEHCRRLPWGVLAPRVFVAMALGLALSLPRLVAALIASKQIGPSIEGDKTTFLTDFANRPPSFANLASTVLAADASWRLDADGSGGLTVTTGTGTAAETGAGTSPADQSAYGYGWAASDHTTGYAAAKGHLTGVQTAAGTNDFALSLLGVRVDLATAGQLVCKQVAGGVGITVTVEAGPILRAVINDGTGSATINSATLASGTLPLCTLYADRSGSAQWHVGGATSGSAAVISGAALTLGATCAVEVGTAATVWLAGAALHLVTLTAADNSATELARYADVTGQGASKSRGTATPTIATRADEILLRYEDATLGTLWRRVAAGVPTIDHDSSGAVGYAPNLLQAVGPANNGDLNAASWVKFGTASVASSLGPDGVARNCHITLGAISADHLVCSAGYVTGATTADVGVCVRRRLISDTGTLQVFNGITSLAGNWHIMLSGLEVGRWYWLTASSPEVSVVVPFAPSSGVINPGFAGYGGAVTCDAVFPTVVKDGTVTRPVITGAAVRTTGAEVRPYTEDSTNVPVAGMRITLDCALQNIDAVDAVLAQISDGGGAAEIVQLRCEGTGDYAAATVTTGSSVVADVQGTTDIADGTRRTLVGIYRANDVRLRVAGTAEGTPDTSAARPTGLDRIEVGHSSARVYSMRVEAA